MIKLVTCHWLHLFITDPVLVFTSVVIIFSFSSNNTRRKVLHALIWSLDIFFFEVFDQTEEQKNVLLMHF